MAEAADKRLVILGGSRQAIEGIRQIKNELGCEIVIVDYDNNAPGFALADHKIIASVYHLEDCLPKVLAFHAETPVDGVMCIACDVPHIVARIAENLSLPHIPIVAADMAVHKLVMKDQFSAHGVAVPQYALVNNAEDVSQRLSEWGKVVVKPVDSRGSKGVSLLTSQEQCEWSFDHALSNSPSCLVMVEQFLSGPQISSESIVIEGRVVTPALSDRSYEFLDKFSPYIVENGGDMPAEQSAEVVQALHTTLDMAVKTMGILNGVVKGDIVIHGGKPYIIELAARLSGGYYCTHQIPHSTGIQLCVGAAMQALGFKLRADDWEAISHKHVSTRWLIPEQGAVQSFSAKEDVLSQKGVLAFEYWCEIGDEINPAQNAGASVAMVQATGNTRAEAIENANEALSAFDLVVKA